MMTEGRDAFRQNPCRPLRPCVSEKAERGTDTKFIEDPILGDDRRHRSRHRGQRRGNQMAAARRPS